MRRRGIELTAALVALVALVALAASACAPRAVTPHEPLVVPPPIQVPYATLPSSPHLRALDLQGGLEEVLREVAVLDTSTATVALLFPDEGVDLEMEAERANEAALLDELERGGSPGAARPAKIPSIFAVTGTVTYDIPMSDHELVDQWTSYFMGRGRKWYEIWLSRSTRYVPIFRGILKKHGLPDDLVFLAMIESGFSPNAYSWAHAAGPWQFIPATGKRFGLGIDFWLDERRDFERSTEAAARYLTKLHKQFGDWYLAWAAYNAGEGRVERAIRRSGTRDWWTLSRTRHLMRETRHYVPKLLAAAVVSKQPERYGFEEVEYLPPLEWEVVTVTTAVDLGTVARACGDAALEEELKSLNPALRRAITPPGRRWDLRVPPGRGEACTSGLRAIPPEERVTYRYHRVGRGDTAASLAKKYQTTSEAICALNQLDPKKLGLYSELVVPIPAQKDGEIPIVEPPDQFLRPVAYVPEGANVIVHRVQSGDSLWKIAQRYRVSLKKLKLWNGIWRNNSLRVGQEIRIYTLRARAS